MYLVKNLNQIHKLFNVSKKSLNIYIYIYIDTHIHTVSQRNSYDNKHRPYT